MMKTMRMLMLKLMSMLMTKLGTKQGRHIQREGSLGRNPSEGLPPILMNNIIMIIPTYFDHHACDHNDNDDEHDDDDNDGGDGDDGIAVVNT